jgi:hypothetical protein
VPTFEAAILGARQQAVWNQKSYALPEPEDQEKKNEKLNDEDADWETSVDLGVALLDGRYGEALGKIARHETTLMNDLAKTLQMLRLLRHDRANNKDEFPKLKVFELPPAA